MRRAVLPAVLLIAACQGRDEPENQAEEASNRVEAATENAAPPSSTAKENSTAPTGGDGGDSLGSLPPPDAPLRFVGRWAAEQAGCRDGAWRFTEDSLSTPAGSQCRFTQVRAVPGGYDIAARCTAEGPETDDRITLRFAESARAMLFESGAIADAGLIYCGK